MVQCFNSTSSLTTQPEVDEGALYLSLYTLSMSDNVQRDRYSAPPSTSGSRAHAHAHASCLLSVPSHRLSFKARVLSGRSSAARPWPYLRRLETKNRGQSGGSHGWNSALERRSRVWAPGCGSTSPVATFSSCVVGQTCTSYVHTSLHNTHWQCFSNWICSL